MKPTWSKILTWLAKVTGVAELFKRLLKAVFALLSVTVPDPRGPAVTAPGPARRARLDVDIAAVALQREPAGEGVVRIVDDQRFDAGSCRVRGPDQSAAPAEQTREDDGHDRVRDVDALAADDRWLAES